MVFYLETPENPEYLIKETEECAMLYAKGLNKTNVKLYLEYIDGEYFRYRKIWES